MKPNTVMINRNLLKWLLHRAIVSHCGVDASEEVKAQHAVDLEKWEEAVHLLHPHYKRRGRPISTTKDGKDRDVTLAEIYNTLISEGYKPMQICKGMADNSVHGESELFPSRDEQTYIKAVKVGNKRIIATRKKEQDGFETLKALLQAETIPPT